MQVIRSSKNPIIYPDMPGLRGQVASNINGPSLIRVPDWIKNPLARYYLYFAHHQGQYIRLAYANNLQDSWTIYQPGTLHLSQTICKHHIASPDIVVDHQRCEIRMYYHGMYPKQGQVTFVAVSKDGIHFTPSSKILGPFYFRVFKYNQLYYAIAKNKNIGGVILRSKDGLSPFEKGINFIVNMRHAAILLQGDTLNIFYSRIGDSPESILMSNVDLKQDCKSWTPSSPVLVLEPEQAYEGIDLPIEPSQKGAAPGRVRQLRDPAIYQEGNKYYLLYSVAGESGIAIAELNISLFKTLSK